MNVSVTSKQSQFYTLAKLGLVGERVETLLYVERTKRRHRKLFKINKLKVNTRKIRGRERKERKKKEKWELIRTISKVSEEEKLKTNTLITASAIGIQHKTERLLV